MDNKVIKYKSKKLTAWKIQRIILFVFITPPIIIGLVYLIKYLIEHYG